MKESRGTVGFTTTIPVEILFAGGFTPCDLNNIFVSDEDPSHFLGIAERDGFPKNMCAWIKGLYGVIIEKNIGTVVTVLEGDCSNTRALAEILQYKGVRTIPFSYPYDRDEAGLRREMEKLMKAFGTTEEGLQKTGAHIEKVREKLRTLDRMTWEGGLVTGRENHYWLVSSSDMMGDYNIFEAELDDFLHAAPQRRPGDFIRLGYVGVPPIFPDLYDFIEDLGGRVVFNETQRQFSLPHGCTGIVERYLRYTYPYGTFARISDIREEMKRRRLDGIIHYVQAFCYRVVEDMILKENLPLPMITIEGDLPKGLDMRTTMRVEAFMEMLKGRGHGTE